MELHLGRLIDHVHLVVADFARSKKFYTAALQVLGIPIFQEGADYFSADELFVSAMPGHSASNELTGRVHLAFQAKDQEMVRAFHAACIAAGGTDSGAPGERHYHPGYFAAFVRDPDGNNIEAVFHGPATRSAASVKITT